MVWLTIVTAGISLIILGVLILLDWSLIWKTHKSIQIGVGILFIFFGLTVTFMIWIYRGQILLCEIFLRYAGIFLRYYSPKLYATIPIWMIITLLYNALWWYQHKTFLNFYPPVL
jgi:hypothetical protein